MSYLYSDEELSEESSIESNDDLVNKSNTEYFSDVENNLVSLVRIAAQVESVVGIKPEEVRDQAKERDIEEEGPQVKAEEREDVVNSQDEVDDLLSSLGF